MGKIIQNNKLVLPELSYKIVGALFEVSNEFGTGYQEKYYYPAVKRALEKSGLGVKMQIPVPVRFAGEKISNYFLDFLVEEKVILEIKVGGRFKRGDFTQVKAYLKATGKPLGILARIAYDGVTFHRVLPPK